MIFKGSKDFTFYLYYLYFKLLILIIKESNKVIPSIITSRGIRAKDIIINKVKRSSS